MDFDKAAQKLKEKGNTHYQRKEYLQAIKNYQEGFSYTNDSDPFFKTNIALCFIKLMQYEQAIEECKVAIKLNPKFVKAYYLMGEAYLHTMHYDDAEKAFLKAEVLAKELHNTSSSMLLSIYKGIDQSRARKYEKQEQERQHVVIEMKKFVGKLMRESEKKQMSDSEREEFNLKQFQLESFFDQNIHPPKELEVPDVLCCKITFTIMRDPVVTPSGISYERSAILKHLKDNGLFDPVTRTPLSPEQLYPNLTLKEIIDDWIRKYPYTITEDHYYSID
ncbi:hypothetical protein FDP41_003361 [Naegleria fowleri]|uniref:E3 ubiquitin-protein ligase CHIP n=1 Tax=Naegleria fowleri TaxID=5763 RepID=A0A6A5BWS3_NAEFO|nr:uncharacterized protein FDP41_003361 [Naegleria fowleri]KAF0977369.1 hypothetical protein FDP41_003361 [Naegleria fowleri]CAG4718627.1 unnamed protein product [Naegleria fowleri]